MYYFAYGSNMSLARLRERVPSAERVGAACLDGYRLCFHMRGTDASAKCDAFFTGRDHDRVLGAVFSMSEDDKAVLDVAESSGVGYEEKWVELSLPDRPPVKALVYLALHIDRSLKPFCWYKYHVVQGARDSALPLEYIQTLDKVVCVTDSDEERHEREMSIYLSVD